MSALTIEDIRNPSRKTGFDHVQTHGGGPNSSPSTRKWRGIAYGGKADKAGRAWYGPSRPTPEAAAQDYCDHINGGSGVTPVKQLRSAGHAGKRRALRRDEELDAALGLIRDRRGELEGRQGYVYYITDGEYAKIGYSTNPQARLAELQTGNARPLRLVWYFAGTPQDEADLHQKFIGYNVLQEWFRPSVELSLEFFNRKDRVTQ